MDADRILRLKYEVMAAEEEETGEDDSKLMTVP